MEEDEDNYPDDDPRSLLCHADWENGYYTVCGEEETLSSHYHCPVCGEECGMMGCSNKECDTILTELGKL